MCLRDRGWEWERQTETDRHTEKEHTYRFYISSNNCLLRGQSLWSTAFWIITSGLEAAGCHGSCSSRLAHIQGHLPAHVQHTSRSALPSSLMCHTSPSSWGCVRDTNIYSSLVQLSIDEMCLIYNKNGQLNLLVSWAACDLSLKTGWWNHLLIIHPSCNYCVENHESLITTKKQSYHKYVTQCHMWCAKYSYGKFCSCMVFDYGSYSTLQ